MERYTKMVLVLALLLASFALSLDGREIKDKPEQPQNFIGFGGFFGTPIGFGLPLISTVPAVGGGGGAPVIPLEANGDEKNGSKP